MARGRVVKQSEDSWSLIFDLPRGADGKRRQKRVTVKGTKKDAEAKLAKLLDGANTGTYVVDPGRRTVKAFLEEWLKTTARLRVSPNTWARYESIVRLHLVPHLGHLRLDRLTGDHIEALWLTLEQEGARKDTREGGLHPRTRLHCHRVLHTALEAAVKKGIIARNPCDAAEAPRQERAREVKVLDEAQLNRLLQTARGTRLFVPVLISACTAMRRGEVLALRWADVNFDEAAIAVRRSLEQTKGNLRFKETKSGTGRVVPMAGYLATELRRHKAHQAAHRLQYGPGYQNNDLIVAQPNGQPMSPDALTGAFEHLVAKTDVPRVTFHTLRHTAATLMLGRGVGVKMVQDMLGHGTPGLTLGTYGHVLKAHQQEAARQMDEALRPTAESL
jgi:integrase